MDVLRSLGAMIFKMFAADLGLTLIALADVALTALALRAHAVSPAWAPFLLVAGVCAALAVGVWRGVRNP